MNISIDGYVGFFPKKTNFDQVTTDEILAALELINQRPLKKSIITRLPLKVSGFVRIKLVICLKKTS